LAFNQFSVDPLVSKVGETGGWHSVAQKLECPAETVVSEACTESRVRQDLDLGKPRVNVEVGIALHRKELWGFQTPDDLNTELLEAVVKSFDTPFLPDAH